VAPPPYVLNPGFEGSLASWALTDADASCTATLETTITNAGSAGSLKMVNTGTGKDDFMRQDINAAASLVPSGYVYQVTAWYNCTVFTSGATGNRGLTLVASPSNDLTNTPITAATAGWVQIVCFAKLRTTDKGLVIRLYSPQGTIYWDDISYQQVAPYVPQAMPRAA
jgi:hypothetical protein